MKNTEKNLCFQEKKKKKHLTLSSIVYTRRRKWVSIHLDLLLQTSLLGGESWRWVPEVNPRGLQRALQRLRMSPKRLHGVSQTPTPLREPS